MTVESTPALHSSRGDEVIAAAQRLAPVFASRAAEHDRDASVPAESFALLAEAGLLNLTTPVALGGDGLGTAVVCRVIQEIATGDPATALILAMQYNQHAGLARSHRWPKEVYERFCRESVEGISLVNAARVEPELGTPARGGLPATVARKTADGWSLTGRKIYTTGAPVLSYAIVWAKTDEDPVRVGSFLLPMNAPGVTIEHTWNHLGMRGTGSDDLVMTNVHLPEEYGVDVRTQEEWKTAAGDNLGSAQSGLVLSALYNGVAIAARNWLAKYLNERVPTNLGASLSTLPRFQTVMGEIETLLYINERLLFGLAENIDNGVAMKPGEAGIVKTVVTENAIKATAMGLELTGNPGLSRDNPLERHYRDVLCGRIHTPQSDAVFLAAGKTAFGMPSSARA